MNSLSAAIKFLTIWNCFSVVQPTAETIGKGVIFFPLVGIAVGLVLALANYLFAPYLHPEILSVVLITLFVVASAGRHLEGLYRTFAVRTDKSPRFDRQENFGVGITALLLVILFKIAAADSMDEKLALSLLLTPLLARWALVTFLYGYHSRFEEAPGLISAQIRLWHFLVSTLATVAIAVYFLGRKGLWITLVLSFFALSIRGLLYRRHGILTQDHLGAVVELCEVLSLIMFASL